MQPNYLAFAQQINQAGDFTPTLSSLGRGIDERRIMKMEEDQNQRRNRLADLQYEAADMDNQARMGELKSLVNRYGTEDRGELSAQIAAARGFQADEAQMAAAQERATKAIGDYWGRLDHFAKAGASPEFLTEMTRIGFKADPVLSGIKPDSITYVDKDGMTITDDFPDGALVNPMTGQPMPAGRYSVESKRTGDPNKPYKPIKIEPAKVEMPKHIPEGAAIPDGKGGWVVPAPRKEKPIVVNAGGGAGTGKAPSGYRYTPEGNLEAIPGGPAAQKQADRIKNLEDGKAAIDLSIATVDKLANHPGRNMATGKSRVLQAQRIPGTDAYDFDKELESFDAQLFLSNIQSMKGMGALSNAEGAKVSAAAGAIKPGMKDESFLANIKFIKTTLENAKKRIETGKLINPDGSPVGTKPPAGKRPDPLGIL